MDEAPELPSPDETRVIRPRPGGRSAPRPVATPSAPSLPPRPPPDEQQTLNVAPRASGSPASDAPSLIPLAMPLLQLMARLRIMATEPDVADLRARTEAELRGFEARAEKAGVAKDLLRRAHYALCASLDDMVLNTPWGARGAWAEHTMVATFHPAVGADRFFDVLRQAQDKALRPVLELMVACLALGVMGRFRAFPDGAAEVERIRAEAAAALALAPPPAELSPHWRGVAAPFAPRRARLPVWVAASLALALAAGGYVLVSLRLADRADAVFADLLAAPPAHMPEVARQAIPVPPPPPPPEPSVQDRLRARLGPQIAAGQVTLAGSPAAPVLRLPERALFAPGAAVPQADAAALLAAVAAALQPEDGRLDVLGYTDNRPVRTVLFPSAVRLTAAQAQAVRAGLARSLAQRRIGAEGRASADPIAPNATPEGREQNRRVEIVLDPSPAAKQGAAAP